jgi:glycerol uptake facilitator protein
VHYGATSVSQIVHGHALPGLLAEILGTFVLMFAIMACAVNPRGERSWAGLVIGVALGFAVMTFAPVSGAGLNPARWFGPAVVGNQWGNWLIYIIGPLAGALLAGFVYEHVVIRPEGKVEKRPIDTLG